MKCSGLTMQSADITLPSIGKRHRHACTDALLEKYTLAQFLFLSLFFFNRRGGTSDIRCTFSCYSCFMVLLMFQGDFKNHGKLQKR